MTLLDDIMAKKNHSETQAGTTINPLSAEFPRKWEHLGEPSTFHDMRPPTVTSTGSTSTPLGTDTMYWQCFLTYTIGLGSLHYPGHGEGPIWWKPTFFSLQNWGVWEPSLPLFSGSIGSNSARVHLFDYLDLPYRRGHERTSIGKKSLPLKAKGLRPFRNPPLNPPLT